MKRTLTLWLLLLGCWNAYSQSGTITVELGPNQIGENEVWAITITANGERINSYGNFPDIDGFRKRGTSSSTSQRFINGQFSSSQSIIMNYAPSKQGTFTIPSFKIKVNDKEYNVQGKKVIVGPAVKVADPFAGLFDRDPTDPFSRTEPEFVDVKEDAILMLRTDKDAVYVGEGVTATLSFLVADNNMAAMQFYNLGPQLSDILKKLRPANCWEENFEIENVEGEHITINGKGYMEYKIYQAAFFPLNEQPIKFSSVGLEMIKYKVAKNPSFFGQNRKEDFKKFFSKDKVIKVKPLPPHPLSDRVAVGDYKLEERLNSTNLETGQSVSYDFIVMGEGNVSSVNKPDLPKNSEFEFYEPNTKQVVNKDLGRVTGSKSFAYFMIPKEPGTYNLGDYFKWIYFNPRLNRYDTLQSRQVVKVTGDSKKNQIISSTDLGSFYDTIDTADNTIRTSSDGRWLKWGANIFAVIMVGLSIYIVARKKPAE